VGDDLVAEEVEVDPLVRAAAFGTAERGAVEVACGIEVVDGEGDVERGEHGAGGLLFRIITCWGREEADLSFGFAQGAG